jgi:transcriptional regulator with XRE-family HTH domain
MAKKKTNSRHNALANKQRLRYMEPVDFKEMKRRRKELGLTQAEAARRAGWATPQVWTNMENGQRKDPQVSTLMKVADVLGCKVDDLLRK